MSKTTAPLLSFDARGQIGKSQVYSSWKGRAYARRYVIPSNPQSVEQTKTRSAFAWLQGAFKLLPAIVKDGWTAYANTSRITAANAFLKGNLSNLRDKTKLDLMLLSPAANSGLPAAAATFTGGDDKVTVTLTAATLPAGWSIVEARAAAIRDQDPQTEAFYTVIAGSDNAAPYSIEIAGLASGVKYQCGAWFVYTKSDGTLAYGEAIMGDATTT